MWWSGGAVVTVRGVRGVRGAGRLRGAAQVGDGRARWRSVERAGLAARAPLTQLRIALVRQVAPARTHYTFSYITITYDL